MVAEATWIVERQRTRKVIGGDLGGGKGRVQETNH